MQVHFLKFIRRFEAKSHYFNLDLNNTPCITSKYCIYFAPHILQLKPLKSPALPPSSAHCRGLSQGARKLFYNLHTYPRLQKTRSPHKLVRILTCLYNTAEQSHFPPFGLIVWGTKSKTPSAVMVLLQEPYTANPVLISYAFLNLLAWLVKWHCSSSHLPNRGNWARNTSLFRHFNKYRHIYICMHIHKVMVARWRSLPALMSYCSSSKLFTDLCVTGFAAWLPGDVDQPPQFTLTKSPRPLGSAVIWKGHILTNTLMHFCHSNICIDVMGKIMQWKLLCAGKVVPMALSSFYLSSTR